LEDEQGFVIYFPQSRHKIRQRFFIVRHDAELGVPATVFVGYGDGFQVDQASIALEQIGVAQISPLGWAAFFVRIAAFHCIDDETITGSLFTDLDGCKQGIHFGHFLVSCVDPDQIPNVVSLPVRLFHNPALIL
jgi:hypothetical protein